MGLPYQDQMSHTLYPQSPWKKVIACCCQVSLQIVSTTYGLSGVTAGAPKHVLGRLYDTIGDVSRMRCTHKHRDKCDSESLQFNR